MWLDHNLQWDPNEYSNITSIRVTSEYVWTPGN